MVADIRSALEGFFGAPEGLAVYGVVVIALADFILGVLAALRDGTFELQAVAAWVRKHIWGRVAPVAVMLALGYFAAQPALTAVGAIAAATYLAETLGSIRTSWGAERGEQAVPQD